MLTVTTDELTAHLHDLLARVAAGEEVSILDHGRAVARLVGERAQLRERLAAAVAAGEIELASQPVPSAPMPVCLAGTPASVLLTRDRQSRDDHLAGPGPR